MHWRECEKDFIRRVEIDAERIESLKKKALLRLTRARNTTVNTETISFVVEDYYEVIKELLIGYLLKNGLRSKNHQCLISFFYKNNPQYEKESYLISQMSYFRNRLSYYGEDIPMDFYQKNKKEFEHIISLLVKLIS
ncbi:MAG: hypothetical protein AABX16_03355 [Nanoarchaeota archaeon]